MNAPVAKPFFLKTSAIVALSSGIRSTSSATYDAVIIETMLGSVHVACEAAFSNTTLSFASASITGDVGRGYP